MAGCTLVGNRSGTPEPAYTRLERVSAATDEGTVQIEIRRYDARVAAEVKAAVKGTRLSTNGAFRLLFDYISGANQDGEKVAMTVPVSMPTAAGGTRIPMTVPVEDMRQAVPDDTEPYVMRFFLPESYTADTAPRPTHQDVRIVEVPPQDMAVLRYSGFRTTDRTDAYRRDLLAALAQTSWRPIGAPVSWSYDPPWTLPFFRRNEVAVAVTRDTE